MIMRHLLAAGALALLLLNVDIFNALNANPVLTENSSFVVWRTPTDIPTARFVRFSVQYDL